MILQAKLVAQVPREGGAPGAPHRVPLESRRAMNLKSQN